MLLASGAVLHTAVATTQEPGRVYRVGIMAIIRREEGTGRLLSMSWLGWGLSKAKICGSRVVSRCRMKMPRRLRRRSPEWRDAILTGGAWDTRAAQKATRTNPDSDRQRRCLAGGIGGIPRPSRREYHRDEHSRDRARRQAAGAADGSGPTARQIAALAAAGVTPPEQLRALEDAARKHGIELSVHLASKPEEIVPAIEEARGSGAQALNVLAATLLNANRRLIIERAAAFKLPAIYQWPDMAEAGGLAAYGPNFNKLGGQRARQLIKLLQETKPADLPVEQPDKFELAINLRTARAIGLEVPAALLDLADKVIE